MGMFSKIFGAKPMTGDARVVEVLLDSIKAGADPATQVAAVRSMMGDAKDETFTGYLDELAGITGDEDKSTVAKAIDIVKNYYRDNIAGDEKEIEVKKDGNDKNVEVKKDGKETKDIEVKKDGDKKDVTVKETGDADKKENGDKKDESPAKGDACNGDEIATIVAKAVAAEFARRDAEKKVNDEPKVNGDELARLSAVMSGDSKKDGTTSDKLMSEIF